MRTLIAVQGRAWERGVIALSPYFDGELPIFGSDVFGSLATAEGNGFERLKEKLAGRMGGSSIGCIDLEEQTLRKADLPDDEKTQDAWRIVMLTACRCVLPGKRWGCYNEPRIQYNNSRRDDWVYAFQAAHHCDLTFIRLYQMPDDGDVNGLVRRAVEEARVVNSRAECLPIFKHERWAEGGFREAALAALEASRVESAAVWFQVDDPQYAPPDWVTMLRPPKAP